MRPSFDSLFRKSHKKYNKPFTSTPTVTLCCHQTRNFGLLRAIFSSLFQPKPTYESYPKKGRAAVIAPKEGINIKGSQLTNSAQTTVKIEDGHTTMYDSSKEIIVRNYSTSLITPDLSALNNAFTHLSDDGTTKKESIPFVLGRSVAGVIDFIPVSLERELSAKGLKLGDRVMGMVNKANGHAFADYVPIQPSCICKAPDSIPLHYLGLMPFSLLTMIAMFMETQSSRALYDFNKETRGKPSAQKDEKSKQFLCSLFEGKSILFLGSGRNSHVRNFLPFLCLFKVSQIGILLSSERHRKSLQKLIEILGCRENVLLYQSQEKRQSTGMDYMDELGGDRYDVVIDSIANSKELWSKHSSLIDLKGESSGDTNQSKQKHGMFAAMQLGKVMFDIQSKASRGMIKSINSVMEMGEQSSKLIGVKNSGVGTITPGLYNTSQTVINQMRTLFEAFENNALMKGVDFPIVVDKYYSLDDLGFALEYSLRNEEGLLGENIGFLLSKEKPLQNTHCQIIKMESVDSFENDTLLVD